MVIAAHIAGKKENYGYLRAALSNLAAKYPSDRFIIFSANAVHALPENCIQVPVLPKPINNLLLYYWYNYKLPSLLIKYNANAFITDTGMLCMKTAIPQYLYFSNNLFEKGRKTFFKKTFRQGLAKAKTIFTAEDFITDDLSAKYPISAGKIQTVYHGLPVYPSSAEELPVPESSYYLYPVSAASSAYLLTILKAFSQLKKRQKTSMKLVLLLRCMRDSKMIPDLKNYRFRDEVMIMEGYERTEGLIKNSFGLIWFCNYDDADVAFASLKYGVPLIVQENEVNTKLFGNAVMLTNSSENAVAEKMQLLYKDENLKNALLENARLLLKKYDEDRATDQLRAAIMP